MTDDEVVPAYWPYDFLEADAIRQHLEGMDISCHLEGENLTSLTGGGFFGNSSPCRMRLLVRRGDLARVREIIEEHEWPRYA